MDQKDVEDSSADPDHTANMICLFRPVCPLCFCFVWVEALHPSQQFFSHVGTFSWVEPVLSNENEMSRSRTQHCAPGEILTRNLAIKSLALYQLS